MLAKDYFPFLILLAKGYFVEEEVLFIIVFFVLLMAVNSISIVTRTLKLWHHSWLRQVIRYHVEVGAIIISLSLLLYLLLFIYLLLFNEFSSVSIGMTLLIGALWIVAAIFLVNYLSKEKAEAPRTILAIYWIIAVSFLLLMYIMVVEIKIRMVFGFLFFLVVYVIGYIVIPYLLIKNYLTAIVVKGIIGIPLDEAIFVDGRVISIPSLMELINSELSSKHQVSVQNLAARLGISPHSLRKLLDLYVKRGILGNVSLLGWNLVNVEMIMGTSAMRTTTNLVQQPMMTGTYPGTANVNFTNQAMNANKGEISSLASDTMRRDYIICPNCNMGNPSKSRFCMKCGNQLA